LGKTHIQTYWFFEIGRSVKMVFLLFDGFTFVDKRNL
jgi:hypothetical protein